MEQAISNQLTCGLIAVYIFSAILAQATIQNVSVIVYVYVIVLKM